MALFEFILAIIALCILGGVLKVYVAGRGPINLDEKLSSMMEEIDLGLDYYSKKKLDPYLKKIEAMEERIQNLEKIATDPRRNLADEIDNLR